MAPARVDPHIGGYVRDGRNLVEGRELVELAAVSVVEERQEVDNRIARQFGHASEQVWHRHSGRVGEVKPAVERAELHSRHILVEAIGVRHSAHHEDVPEIRVQLDRNVDRAFQVHRHHHARGLRSRLRTPRAEHDHCAWKQLVSVPVHEIGHGVGRRDHHVESLTGVLPPEKVTDSRFVVRFRKSRDIQVFGVVIESSGQAVVENGANGAVNVHRHRRTPLQGDQHQHRLLGNLAAATGGSTAMSAHAASSVATLRDRGADRECGSLSITDVGT